MRVYEDDYAYEVEPVIDSSTQICQAWRYNVYRIRPAEQLLNSGQVATREEAEKSGKQLLRQLEKQARPGDADGKFAA